MRSIWPDQTTIPPCGPLARELLLTETEGLVELQVREILCGPSGFTVAGGLWFHRIKVPQDQFPLLFIFPPPYHPVEVMMSNRGWGDEVGVPLGERITRINTFRSTAWESGLGLSARVLGKTRREVADLWHLFTPFHTNHDQRISNANKKRNRVWISLGFSLSQAMQARGKVEQHGVSTQLYQPNFWRIV